MLEVAVCVHLPRCDESTTDLALLSKQCLMEGMAATTRAGLVMAPVALSWGTLKSHLQHKSTLSLSLFYCM